MEDFEDFIDLSNTSIELLPMQYNDDIEVVSNNKKRIDKSRNSKEYSANFCQWQILPNETYCASQKTINQIPPNVYDLVYNNDFLYFQKKNLMSDDFINFPNSKMDEVLKDINEFWNIEDRFKEYGFVFKRGILLYGPAGSGKTVLLSQVMKYLIDKEGIIISTANSPRTIIQGIKILRSIESKKNVIVVIEDIDAYIRNFGEEAVLSFLDGEDSVNNILVLATTNYPEKLDRRIVARPRRFDRIIKIESPNSEMRKIYFEKKLKIKGKEIEEYVKHTENFSFAMMSELVISTKCFDKNFNETVELLKKLNSNKSTSDEYYSSGSQAGFIRANKIK